MSQDIPASTTPQFQELLPLLLQNMQDRAIFMADAQGQILTWAVGVGHLFGYEADEFVGQSIGALLEQENSPLSDFSELLQQVAGHGRLEEERVYLRKDGSRFWGSGPIIALRDDDELRGFAFFLRDVSEQRQAKDQLQDSESRLAAIFARAAVGMSEISLTGRFLRVNDEICRILGRSREELLTLSVSEVTHREDLLATLEGFGNLVHHNIPISIDKRYVRPNGTLVWANSSLTRLNDKAGNAYSVLAVTVDLTERHEAEIALRRAHDQLESRVQERTAELRAAIDERSHILNQLVTAQEEERRRIARELHDQLGQSLVALGLGLESVLAHISPNALPPESYRRLENLHTLTRGLMDQVHDLAWQLRPVILDELGLEVALRQMVNQWQHNTNIPADFLASSGLNGGKSKPPVEIEVALYRVAQECLNNIARHAKASSVSVVYKKSHFELAVIVEDNGVGLDLSAVNANKAKRLGVVGMRERMEAVGGSLTIETSPGVGTTVYARVPLPKPLEA